MNTLDSLQATAFWTNPASPSPYPRTCRVPATPWASNVSWPLVWALSPVPTCSTAPNCGAPERQRGRWCARPATFPGQTAPAVVRASSASRGLVWRGTISINTGWVCWSWVDSGGLHWKPVPSQICYVAITVLHCYTVPQFSCLWFYPLLNSKTGEKRHGKSENLMRS